MNREGVDKPLSFVTSLLVLDECGVCVCLYVFSNLQLIILYVL